MRVKPFRYVLSGHDHWLETERRSALITGGSRGIGRGIATHLSQQGRTRTLVGRARVQLAQVHSELDIAAAAVHIVAADQTVDAAIELHRRTFGSMIALILAAGVARPDPSRTIPKPRLDKQIALNFRSPFLLAGQAMPLLRAEAAASGTGSARVMIPERTGRRGRVGPRPVGTGRAVMRCHGRSLG
ncbi:MAG: SDR family NAD(P)-dependent oxidoreductase [Mycobacterium sp.]